MKKIAMFLMCIAVLCLPVSAFAQQARVKDVSGEVTVKKDASGQWERAKTGMLLDKNAELETKRNAYCTLSFDKKDRNIVTIKQNSRIKIESVRPGNIYLPKGRVLSLINKASRNEKFQVRTPTAIAGARGTAWGTGISGINTNVQCFRNNIFLQGLDANGNVTVEQGLSQGMGVDIGRGGVIGDPFHLGDDDYNEWNDFAGYVNDLTGGGSQGGGGGGTGGGGGSPDDLRNDQRDDLRENTGEQLRQDSGQQEPGGQGGGGGNLTP